MRSILEEAQTAGIVAPGLPSSATRCLQVLIILKMAPINAIVRILINTKNPSHEPDGINKKAQGRERQIGGAKLQIAGRAQKERTRGKKLNGVNKRKSGNGSSGSRIVPKEGHE